MLWMILRLDNDSTPKMLAAPCSYLHSQVLVFQRIKYDTYELRQMVHILFMGEVDGCSKSIDSGNIFKNSLRKKNYFFIIFYIFHDSDIKIIIK